ncbi:MAG TPA: chorismate mutase [Candidatus Cybelea sp.]|nr:chorismate mutase [Candidatus Cybelea sp.]
MSASADELGALRREIDEIDDRIHDLLMRRTDVVERIAVVKRQATGGPVFMRPGREAAILRRLLARHKGTLPRAVIARVWRELISAYCRLEGPFSVAVLAPAKSVGYWDMARRHYGSSTQMMLYRNVPQVLSAVTEGQGVLGILPVPQEGESDPWWPHLGIGTGKLRIVMRLPFLLDDAGQFEKVTALVVAAAEPEPSGDDASYIAIANRDPMSRARLNELLRKSGIDGHSVSSVPGSDAGGGEVHLIEADGFIGPDDGRLAELIALSNNSVRQAASLGAYAKPVPLP